MFKYKKYLYALLIFAGLFLIFVLFPLSLFNYYFSVNKISGISMQPNFNDKSYVLTKNKFKKKDLHRGQVVVFKLKDPKDNKIYEYIKRIIAIPGDTIETNSNSDVILINNIPIDESSYAFGYNGRIDKTTLKDGEYFVMGDNRNHSYDSRVFGTVSYKDIKGVLFQ